MNEIKTKATPPQTRPIPGIPYTADAWELYSSEAGADEAAKKLGDTLHEKVSAVLAEPSNSMHARAAAAERIRDEMYVLMRGYSKLGARDTEPECILLDVLERVLDLDKGTLDR